MRWVEEGQPQRNRSSKVVPHSIETQVVSTCEENWVVSSEFVELKDMVLRQQAKLNLILKALSTPEWVVDNANRVPRSRFCRAPDGHVLNVVKLVI